MTSGTDQNQRQRPQIGGQTAQYPTKGYQALTGSRTPGTTSSRK